MNRAFTTCLPVSGRGACATRRRRPGRRVIQERTGGLLARTAHASTSPYQPSTHAYYHADGNGNVAYLLNQDRSHGASYKYDPYGRLIASSGSLAAGNLLRFSSKPWHDHSETYYYGYRFYLPEGQRWVNRDPLGEPAFELVHHHVSSRAPNLVGTPVESLQGPNLYAFVANNAVNDIDPEGLFGCLGCAWAIHKANKMAKEICKPARDAYRRCLTDTPKSGGDADFDSEVGLKHKKLYDNCVIDVMKKALNAKCFACVYIPRPPIPGPPVPRAK